MIPMMLYQLSLLAPLLAYAPCAAGSATALHKPPTLTSPLGPVVNLGYAAFAGNTTSPTGVQDGPVTFFGGIPYAEPPLVDLRWRAPKKLDEGRVTTNVSDARGWGAPCIQRPAVLGVGSEDCLKLNIWKPTNVTNKAALPVAVYIHGGGFYYGTPQGFPLYDWVNQHPGGIIGVSFAYRMSIFGFLGGAVVEGDGNLNVGLLDQRAALEWIQRHIAEFGGDPDNVTIYGESAGGASVVMQITAYGGSKPVPFKRATAQSIGFGPTKTAEQVAGAFTSAVALAGCPTGAETMPCLRQAPVSNLITALNTIPNGAFAPIVEGPSGFMPDLPTRLITAGRFSAVDFVGGHCTGDGKFFSGGTPENFVTDDDIRTRVFSRWPAVTNATAQRVLAIYPAPNVTGSPFPTQWDRASTMAGEIIYNCMDWLLADRLLAKGVRNVFTYSWDAPDTVLWNAKPYLGAMHTSDLYFLFAGTNTLPNAGFTFTPFNATEALLSEEAIGYWTSFAAKGDPNIMKKSTSPVWEPFKADKDARRHLFIARGDSETKTKSVMETIPAAEIERCRFMMSTDLTNETRI